MGEQTPRLKVSGQGDVTVVELIDRKILDEVSITQLGDQLTALVAASPRLKLVLDFSGVAHMSSSALGVLITVHKRIRERNGQLRLCCIQPAIQEVFAITRLNEVFDISPTRHDAVAELR